jgi:glutamate--cysteine ligase
MVTLEPGGQVEISSQPHPSLADLHAAVDTELNELIDVLHASGLRLGGTGIDAHRSARRLLRSPRYDAMAESFARRGPQGEIMMCSTAGLQICLDAGPADGLSARWAALHEFGPTLVAVFANSRRYAGHDTGWASARMRAWLGIEPDRTRPVGGAEDPAAAWATYALRAPLLCVRRPEGHWHAPPGVSFADWINGALPVPPTVDDLDYHLGTLFPPVRPRGYLEVRYLDAQPLERWFTPVAVVAALLADDKTVDAVRDICAPAANRWMAAARFGLADPVLAAVAPAVLDLACRAFDRVGLPAGLQTELCDIVDGLLARGRETRP